MTPGAMTQRTRSRRERGGPLAAYGFPASDWPLARSPLGVTLYPRRYGHKDRTAVPPAGLPPGARGEGLKSTHST